MPSYARDRWAAAFFILFLAVNLYWLMNFLTAILFVVFNKMGKNKFRKLLLHKREACQLAFRLLVNRAEPHTITYEHFRGLMKHFKPLANNKEVFLIFKALNKSHTGVVSLNEFYQVYTACSLEWNSVVPLPLWYFYLPFPLPAIGKLIKTMIIHPAWEIILYIVICSNGIVVIALTMLFSSHGGVAKHLHVQPYEIAFVSFYGTDVMLKLIGLGVSNYFRNGWNIFDFIVTMISFAGVLGEFHDHSFYCVIIIRILRLFRLFKVKKRYRDAFETINLLVPLFFSACLVIGVIYYFFSIIGMEIFGNYNLKHCCINTTVEQYFNYIPSSKFNSYYYYNNFDNIFVAGVTLFELTVVNNWYIIMEAYAHVTGEPSRFYFISFYLIMMVVMSVVLAAIIEAFTFRMQYNHAVNKDKHMARHSEVTKVVVDLTLDEVNYIYGDTITPTETVVIQDGGSVVCEAISSQEIDPASTDDALIEPIPADSIVEARTSEAVSVLGVTTSIGSSNVWIGQGAVSCTATIGGCLPRSVRRQREHDTDLAKRDDIVQYLGRGKRNKEALQMRMYRHLLRTWIKDSQVRHRDNRDRENRGRDEHDANRRKRRSRNIPNNFDEPVVIEPIPEVQVSGAGDVSRWENVRRKGVSIASSLSEWWKTEVDANNEEGTPIWCPGEEEGEVEHPTSFPVDSNLRENPLEAMDRNQLR